MTLTLNMPSMPALSVHAFGTLAFVGGCINLMRPEAAVKMMGVTPSAKPVIKG